MCLAVLNAFSVASLLQVVALPVLLSDMLGSLVALSNRRNLPIPRGSPTFASTTAGHKHSGASRDGPPAGYEALEVARPTSNMVVNESWRASIPLLGGPAIAWRARKVDEQTWLDLKARVSHEIRTPLNAVIGFSDLIEREIFGPLGDTRYREYVGHIRASSTVLLKAAEHTLAIATLVATRHETGSCERVALAPLFLHAWRTLEPEAASRNVAWELNVQGGLEVYADRRAMGQVAVYLLTAAIRRGAAGHNRLGCCQRRAWQRASQGYRQRGEGHGGTRCNKRIAVGPP